MGGLDEMMLSRLLHPLAMLWSKTVEIILARFVLLIPEYVLSWGFLHRRKRRSRKHPIAFVPSLG